MVSSSRGGAPESSLVLDGVFVSWASPGRLLGVSLGVFKRLGPRAGRWASWSSSSVGWSGGVQASGRLLGVFRASSGRLQASTGRLLESSLVLGGVLVSWWSSGLLGCLLRRLLSCLLCCFFVSHCLSRCFFRFFPIFLVENVAFYMVIFSRHWLLFLRCHKTPIVIEATS